MVSSLSAIASSADTVEQDGLSVSYSTDKDKYSKTDTIKATLKVTNKNSDTVHDLVLDETIPDGYVLADGYYKNKTVSELKSNEVVELDTLFVPKETDNNDDSSNTTSGSSNDSSSSDASNNNSDLSNEPPTTNNVVSNLATNNSATKTPDVVAPQPTPTPNPTPGPEPSSSIAPSPAPDPTPSPTPDSTPDSAPEPDPSSKEEKGMKGKPGGGDRAWAYAVAAIAVSLTIITVGRKGKTEKKKMLSIAIAGTMITTVILGVGLNLDIGAAAADRSIKVKTNVIVEGKDVVLNATVKYGAITSTPSEEENPSVAEEYYKENADILEVVDVTSDTTLSEEEVTKLLNEKGFKDYPITYNYSLSGDFDSEKESSSSSNVKHPMYGTYYLSKNNEIWYVTIVGKNIYANPLSFNMQTERKVTTMLSTSNTIFGYDDEKDRFYTVIPKESAMIVVKVDDINSDVLDNLTVEEVEKL